MSIDPLHFRQTVGQFVTGVAVIATEIDREIRAMTANSFTALSLHPPLVLFCAGKNTRTGRLVHSAKEFSVNILRRDQESLSTYFAGAWKEPASPPFRFVSWEGGPRLEGCAAALACAKEAVHEGGDHWIVIGRVLALHAGIEPRHPLAFFGGRYASIKKDDAPAPDLELSNTPVLAFYDTFDRE